MSEILNLNEQFNRNLMFNYGFIFEFTPKTDDHDEIVKNLSKTLGRTVISRNSSSYVNYNDDNLYYFEIGSSGFDIGKIYTPKLEYNQAKIVLADILNWIQENGYLNIHSNLHVGLSINKKVINPFYYDINEINRLKFILSFNENKIKDIYPSVDFDTIKRVYISNIFANFEINTIHSENYIIPKTSLKSVKFNDAGLKYMLFSFIQADDYDKKYLDVLKVMEHYVNETYSLLLQGGQNFTQEDLITLKNIVKDQLENRKNIVNYDIFKSNYPDLKLKVDLNDIYGLIKTYYDVELKYQLFKLLIFSGITKADLNYDTERKVLQVKGAKIRNSFQNDTLEFFECDIKNSHLVNNRFMNCKIVNCEIEKSEFLFSNNIDRSEIKQTYIDKSTEIKNSVINNVKVSYSGDFEKCIFMNDVPADGAKIKDCFSYKKLD